MCFLHAENNLANRRINHSTVLSHLFSIIGCSLADIISLAGADQLSSVKPLLKVSTKLLIFYFYFFRSFFPRLLMSSTSSQLVFVFQMG